MRRIFPLFLSLFVCAAAVAQKTQVVGRVLDSEEGEALAYATIQIMKPDSTSMVTGGTAVAVRTMSCLLSSVTVGENLTEQSAA